jgi:DNA polymerase-3 subunit delta'
MLDDYQLLQPVVYKVLKNSIKNKRDVHAYLFEIRDYEKGMEIAFAFTKYILCPNNYSNNSKCGGCSQCCTIDNNNFTEIKVINPDGMWIKKEQLMELQQEFNKKAISSSKKIYIINGAEKLNAQAANSMLKFLEEPEDNIIAILITNNQYQLLDTIVSRCQILSFADYKTSKSDSFIELIWKNLVMNEEDKAIFNIDRIESIINFVNFYESNKMDTILHLNRLWHKNINSRRTMEIAFEIMVLYYKDILNYICNRKIENFKDYSKKIEYISLKEKIKFNMNNNLLMDKLIIMLEGGL